MEYHLSYQGVPLEGPEPYQLSSIRSLMSEHAESPNCACTCHRDTDTCALTGPHRHPRTGCCVCCPTIAVPWQALADTYVTLGRVGYVLRIAEPLLVVGDVLDLFDLYDRSGSAPYEVASIERVMTMPPQQVVNGCQSVLLKPLPGVYVEETPIHPHAQHFAVTKEALGLPPEPSESSSTNRCDPGSDSDREESPARSRSDALGYDERSPGSSSDEHRECLCGHVRGHHAEVNYIQGVHFTYCRWRGCGCPRFMRPKEAKSA